MVYGTCVYIMLQYDKFDIGGDVCQCRYADWNTQKRDEPTFFQEPSSMHINI